MTFVVLGIAYTTVFVAAFRYISDRTPAGIVRRLMRTGRAVSVAVHPANSMAWDPSSPPYQGGIYKPGRGTYTLHEGTVRLDFQPKSGPAISRTGPVPPSLLPDTPEMHRRRLVARVVIALHLAVGTAAFAVIAALGHGAPSIRLRYAAVVALAAVAASWLVTHLILLTRIHRSNSLREHEAGRRHTLASKHLVGWLVGYLIAVGVLGVAWRLGNLDQPTPMSWASAFLSAAVFVLASGAALSASLHHHNYLHHAKDPPADR